jgi:hypothetical protein
MHYFAADPAFEAASSHQVQLSRFSAASIQLSLRISKELVPQPQGTHPVVTIFRL